MPPDPKYRPMYLSNDYDKEKRGIIKFLKRYNWHGPDQNLTDNSWRKNPPGIMGISDGKKNFKQTGERGGGYTPFYG